MKPFEIEKDPGFIDVTIAGKTIPVDIYKTWGQISEIQATTDGQPAAYWEAIGKMLETIGFPPVSNFVSEKFQMWHAEVRAELGKALKGDSKPDSPASTESECSPSTPEPS